MNDVSVNINHLVLSGVTNQALGNGQRLGRMTQTTLQHLIAQRGMPPGLAGRNLSHLIVPRLNLPDDASDRQVAQELALALYRMLGR
jgi:hypothetical protein